MIEIPAWEASMSVFENQNWGLTQSQLCEPAEHVQDVDAIKSPHYTTKLCLQSWMTIKKTEISAQHDFLKTIYLCVYRVTILKYLGVQEKC